MWDVKKLIFYCDGKFQILNTLRDVSYEKDKFRPE